MSQLIVILIVLKKWFKSNNVSIWKILGSIVGLLVSVALYNIYNDIQSQTIQIEEICLGNSNRVKEKDLSLYLDYSDIGQTEYHPTILDDTIKGTTIRYSVVFDNDSIYQNKHDSSYKSVTAKDICNSLLSKNLDKRIDSLFVSSDYFRYFNVVIRYKENNWLFPHIGSTRIVTSKPIVNEQSSMGSHEINLWQVYDIPRDKYNADGLNNLFRRYKYTLFESLFADSLNNTYEYIHSMNVPQTLYTPRFYSAYDISTFNLRINCNIDSLSILKLEFTNIVDFSEIYPSPDIKTATGIVFSEKSKLKYINENGLNLITKFPKLESIQESRNYILSAFITLFFTLLVTNLFNAFLKIKAHRQRVLQIWEKTVASNVKKGLKFYRYLSMYDISLSIVITLLINVINPYDWNIFYQLGNLLIIPSIVNFGLKSLRYRFLWLDYRLYKIIELKSLKPMAILIILGYSFITIGHALDRSVDINISTIILFCISFYFIMFYVIAFSKWFRSIEKKIYIKQRKRH